MRLPILLLIIVSVYSLLIDWYIYRDTTPHSKTRKTYACSTLVCYLLLLAAIIIPKRDTGTDITPLMWMLYTYTTIYAAKTAYAIFSLLGRIPCLWHSPRIRLGLYLGLPLAAILFAATWRGAITTRKQIQVSHVTITSPKLPQSFNNYRIVQFSDAHLGTWGSDTSFTARMVDTINSLRPNLILFTGDIVNRQTAELLPFLNTLRRLHATDGIYSVLGNHDYGDYTQWPTQQAHDANNRQLRHLQASMGWHLLNNAHTPIVNTHGDTIMLIGVENIGDPPFKKYGDLKKAYPHNTHNHIADNKFKILLTHNPVHWTSEVLPTTDIDLTLSGHTHAMQLLIGIGFCKWSPAVWRYPNWGGLYTDTSTGRQLYVNIGCGEVGIPSRIGATPEITLITLRH